MTFEEKIKRLEEISTILENDNLPLQDACKIYQDKDIKEAKTLEKELNDELNESMKKLAFIVEDGQIKEIDINELKKDI